MAHTFAFWCSNTRDVRHHRFSDIRFDKSRRLFFRAAANLTNHHNRFGLRIVLEQTQNIDKGRTWDRVATDTNTARLTKTFIGGLLNRFIRQRTGARNNPNTARQVNMTRHDTNLALTRSDHARTVWPNHAHASLLQTHFHLQHIQRRDPFRDTDDQLDPSIDSFQDGIFTKRCRNVNHRGGRPRRFDRITHGIKYRQSQMISPAFTR